jgi:hypothetical protein
MTYKEKVALFSEIRTKHSKQGEQHVEVQLLNLVVRKETARLLRLILNGRSIWLNYIRNLML